MRTTRLFPRLLLAGIAASAALLAGCTQGGTPDSDPTTPPPAAGNGVADLSAEEILAKAAEALGNASSFRIKGDMTDKGTTVSLDMVVAGTDMSGSFSAEGQDFEVIQVGADVYVMVPEALLDLFAAGEGGELVKAMLTGKYIKTTTDDQDFADLTAMTDVTEEILGGSGTVTKGETTTVDGVAAIAVAQGDNTIYVATEGEPYPLKVENAAEGGALVFSDFNSAPAPTAPPADQVVDLASLGLG